MESLLGLTTSCSFSPLPINNSSLDTTSCICFRGGRFPCFFLFVCLVIFVVRGGRKKRERERERATHPHPHAHKHTTNRQTDTYSHTHTLKTARVAWGARTRGLVFLCVCVAGPFEWPRSRPQRACRRRYSRLRSSTATWTKASRHRVALPHSLAPPPAWIMTKPMLMSHASQPAFQSDHLQMVLPQTASP